MTRRIEHPTSPAGFHQAVMDLLRHLEGLDLRAFKDACIRRRLEQHLPRSVDQQDYLKRLECDEAERQHLIEALTIHVSEFFRDPQTFAWLSHRLLPKLIGAARSSGRQKLRAWSLGCACGEEPYSLALLWKDLAPTGVDLEILATDLSEKALEKGRRGIYAPQRLSEVPPEMLRHFFREEEGGFRIVDEIRDMVRFEQGDALQMSDYPEVDLILCRNMLIYLDRPHQDRIERAFARALGNKGYLVLGHNESLGPAISRRFECIEPDHRIYRSRGADPSSP